MKKVIMGSDKIKHFGACMAVSATAAAIEGGCGATPLQAAAAGFMAGMAIGVGKEYGDSCSPGNRWSWGDIAADALGSAAGATLGALTALMK